ncbi:MAG: hypothetical protein IT532_09485 [Burkholderiales bacterium]|nr:hypothetical protein [Burkholderiales bacterium]
MNRLTVALVVAGLLALGTSAFAQEDDDEHAGHHPAPEAQSLEVQAPQAQSPEAGTSEAQTPEGQAQVPANPLAAGFERMRSLIAQAQTAQDPAARQRLLGEHVQAMREQLRAMRAAAQPPAQPSAQPSAQTEHDHAGAEATDAVPPADRKGRGMMKGKGDMMKGKGAMMGMHRRVEQRLDAIEQMLEQLVEREALEQ